MDGFGRWLWMFLMFSSSFLTGGVVVVVEVHFVCGEVSQSTAYLLRSLVKRKNIPQYSTKGFLERQMKIHLSKPGFKVASCRYLVIFINSMAKKTLLTTGHSSDLFAVTLLTPGASAATNGKTQVFIPNLQIYSEN